MYSIPEKSSIGRKELHYSLRTDAAIYSRITQPGIKCRLYCYHGGNGRHTDVYLLYTAININTSSYEVKEVPVHVPVYRGALS